MPNRYYKRPVIIPPGPSIAYVELTKGQWSVIESQDAAWIGANNWHVLWDEDTESFYASRCGSKIRGESGTVGMHAAIVKPRMGYLPDHINGNTLDNRRNNLREATGSQNQCNKRILKNNKSGYRGVSWSARNGKWVAYIKLQRVQKFIGYFDNPEDAHLAYLEAAATIHGEFCRIA